jgi:hypothetical protein
LLGNGILPSNLWQKTIEWIEKGTEDEKLMARACGIVFLIRKISEFNDELGVKANADTLAHLMVEELSAGSGKLASKLQSLLKNCDLIMRIEDEYHIQTPESLAWNTEFRSEIANFTNKPQIIEIARTELIRAKFGEHFRLASINQGDSKVARRFNFVFDSQLPPGAEDNLTLWIRDGWNCRDSEVISDARMQPVDSPVMFVFIPSRSSDDLRQNLINIKAATAILDSKGAPNTQAGDQARLGIETIRRAAERKVDELLTDAVLNASVIQSGGNEISGRDLKSKVEEAAKVSLQRMFPQFKMADDIRWDKVYEKAHQGSADALRMINDMGEAVNNPVCKEIYNYISGGKKGADIRQNFMGKPYGWSQDAVEGALLVLLVNGIIKAQSDQAQPVDCKQLDRRDISKTLFKIETITISAIQRIKIREPLQKAGVQFKPNEEQAAIPEFIEKLETLRSAAGGEAPQPLPPDDKIINDIRTRGGNEQLLFVYDNVNHLCELIETWKKTADRIAKRLRAWKLFDRLVTLSSGLDIAGIERQHDAIKTGRRLLANPDGVQPLFADLTQKLRDELNRCSTGYDEIYQRGLSRLETDDNWNRLQPEQKHNYLRNYQLLEKSKPAIDVSTPDAILSTLERMNISAFRDRIDSLPSRFDRALGEAAKFFEPEIQEVPLSSRTIKTEPELDAWLANTRAAILKALKNGPVLVR